MSDWGKGAKNNNIGWGQGACDNTIGWGKSQKDDNSWSGDTDISGCSTAVLSITYSSSAFCTNASDPTPTVTNNVGAGTFSSTAGLVFVSTSTGEVDISASTSGATYVITYTDTNAATATFSLTLNALDNAAFSYSPSSYDPSASNPTPTITGLAGGTFSAGSGLVFVDSGSNTGSSTGEINLSASTIASYTITYDTASSGSSVCPNTSTQTVEIAAALAQVSNLYSMEFDGANDFINISSPTATTYNNLSFSGWLNWDNTQYSCAFAFSTLGGQDTSTGLAIEVREPNNGRIRVAIQGSGWLVSTAVIPSNTWFHIAVTMSPTGIIMYKDGVEILNSTATNSLNRQPVYESAAIGVRSFLSLSPPLAQYFGGFLDEIALWNVTLTEQDVQSIYNATETGKTADLNDLTTPPVKWYRMGD